MRALLVPSLAILLLTPTARAQSAGAVYIAPLNAAGGPGAGGSLVLGEPLGGRFANPTRLATDDGALASFSVRSAPDANLTDGRFELALHAGDTTGAVGGGIAVGARSLLPPDAASGRDRVTEHSFELGLGLGAAHGPTFGGTFIVSSSSLDADNEKKDRGNKISFALATAYDVGRYLRLSAVTAPRALQTQLTRGAREIAVGGEVPAVPLPLPVVGLHRLRIGTGAEYGRLVSGPAADDGAVRIGGWIDGLGPLRLRATVERATGGEEWTTDAGATLSIQHLRIGAASSHLPAGGPRIATLSIGVNSQMARWR